MCDKNTELYQAVKSGEVNKVQELLQHRANADYKNLDDFQKTPLHCAAENGHSSVAELLLLQGANIEAKDKDKRTPLHCASYKGHSRVAKLLLSWRANIEAANKDGWTPLHFAAANGSSVITDLLLRKEANIEAANKDGWTPLHFAAANGRRDITELLLVKEANIEAANSYGLTPLHFAAANGHSDVADLLLLKGANIHAVDKDKWTPLHTAAFGGHFPMTFLLLSKGANIEAADKDKWTPLLIARSKSHLDVVKLLHEYKTVKPETCMVTANAMILEKTLHHAANFAHSKGPETFFSLLFSLDSNNTESDSLVCFLWKLVKTVSNVHEMKLFYTLLRAILKQGLISEDECAKEILHEALEAIAKKSTCSTTEAAIFKLILNKCKSDEMIDELKYHELDRTAENTNTANQPFFQNLRDAIEKNTQDIFELRCDVESLKNNIVILEKNIRSVHSTVETMRDALRFKQNVEAALGMLKVVISAVSFGCGGPVVDTFVNAIVDFGDSKHLQDVAEAKSIIKKSLQNGIDAAKKNMGALVKCTAELGANVMIGKRMEEALKKGDPLFVLGYVSVVISAKVSPNPKTLTMDDILMNSSVPETHIAECIFPDAIFSEADEERLEVHATIKYGLKKELEALLQKKEHLASMNTKDSKGRTAADLAALTGQVQLLDILHKNGGKHADANLKYNMITRAQNRKNDSPKYLEWVKKQCP